MLLQNSRQSEGQGIEVARLHVGAQDARRVLEELLSIDYRDVEAPGQVAGGLRRDE